MVDVFIGRHENKVDSKGRMSIPSDFRKVLDKKDPGREPGSYPRFVLLFGDGRRDYIEALTMSRLAAIHRQIRKMPQADKKRKALVRLIYVDAQQLVLDDTGRIVLPPRARAMLNLKDRALIEGHGDVFRICAPDSDVTAALPPADPETGYDPEIDPMDYLDGDFDDDLGETAGE